MIIVDGLNMQTSRPGRRRARKGTVRDDDRTQTKGTRTGQTEQDDAMAAGPSVDQRWPHRRIS